MRVVIPLGPTGAGAAAAVAGRRAAEVRPARNAREVAGLCVAAQSVIVVADGLEVSASELLGIASAVAREAPGVALGILFGRGEAQLLEAAERLRAHPAVAPPDAVQRAYSSVQDLADLPGARLVRVGGPPEQVRALLEAPADLLFVSGHSNGLDMSVGGVLLCRQPTTQEAPAAAFPCFFGEPCARARHGFHKGELVLPVGRLRASRAVWLSCWGVSVADGPFDPALTIGDALLREVRMEALVSTIRVGVTEAPDARLLYYLCNLGLPMGLVANRANHWRQRRDLPAEFLCFGDPESAMAPSVRDVGVARDGACFRLTDVPVGVGPIDVRAALPEGASSPGDVILDFSPGGGLAVLAPDGTLFATLEAGAADAVFRVVDRSAFAGARAAVRAVGAQLDLPRILATGAAARIGADEPAVQSVLGRIAVVRAFAEGWPLGRLPAGMVFHGGEVASLFRGLEDGLAGLGEALVSLHVELTRRLGAFNPSFMWKPHYDFVSVAEGCATCGACGSVTDLHVWEARLDGQLREMRFCLACGPISEAPVGNDAGFALSREAEGRRLRVRAWAKNPLGWAVPARAIAVLAPFLPDGTTPPSESAVPSVVPAGEMAVADLVLNVPPTVPRGVHYLSVAQFVGAGIVYHRLPVTTGE